MAMSIARSLLFMEPGQYNPQNFAFDPATNRLFVIYSNFNSFDAIGIQIDVIDCNTFQLIQSARYPQYEQVYVVKFHSSQNALYVITQGVSPSVGYVTRIDATTLAVIGDANYTSTLPAGRYIAGSGELDTVNNFYYVAISFQSSPAFDCSDFTPGGAGSTQYIARVNVSGGTPTFSSLVTLGATETGITCMAYDSVNNFLWAGLAQVPAKLLKFNTPAITVATTHTFSAGYNRITGITLDTVNGNGFVLNDAEQPTVNQIAKFNLSTITPITTFSGAFWSWNTGNAPPSLVCGNFLYMSNDATHVYAVYIPDSSDTTTPFRIVKVNKSTLVQDAYVTAMPPINNYNRYMVAVLADADRGVGYSNFYSFDIAFNRLYKLALNDGNTLAFGTPEFKPIAAQIGETVVILGTGFSTTSDVSFDGTPAYFTIISDYMIEAQVPSGATSGTISVTGSTGTITTAHDFIVFAAPPAKEISQYVS